MWRRSRFAIYFLTAFLAIATVLAPAPARADWFGDATKGVGDFFTGVVDGGGKLVGEIGKGVITDRIPDKIDIPGTSFSLYPRESAASNVIKNIAPMLSSTIGFLDPMKPVASIARSVISLLRPTFDQFIKPHLPGVLKNGAQAAKDFIKNSLKAVDNAIVRDVIFPVWDFFIGPLDDLVYDVIDLLAEEAKVTLPGAGGGQGSTPGHEPSKMVVPDTVKNQSPTGALIGIDENGIVSGWAVDADTPGQSVWIDLAVDGALSGSVFTDKTIPASVNVLGAMGFRWPIPSKWRDGKVHTIVAKANDTAIGVWSDVVTLSGSPKTFALSAPTLGSLDRVTDDGQVAGWAADRDLQNGTDVELLLDAPRAAGGVSLGVIRANQLRPDFSADWLQSAGLADARIGFSYQIDVKKITGGEHSLYAYAKDYNALTGKTDWALLLPSPMYFRTPKIVSLRFADEPYTVAPGQWVVQKVDGFHGEFYQQLSGFLDGKQLDLNEDKRFAYSNSWAKTVSIGGYASAKKVSAEIKFHVPTSTPLGTHAVTLQSDSKFFVLAPDRFHLNVVAPTGIRATAADTITAGGETDIFLDHLPRFVSFVGHDANTAIKVISLSVRHNEPAWLPAPGVNLTDIAVTKINDDSVKIHARVPLQASSLRSASGPAQLQLVLEARTTLSQDAFQVRYPFEIRTRAKTALGSDPMLAIVCPSSLKPEITVNKLEVSGNGFSCYSELTAAIAGVTLGTPFTLTAMNTPEYTTPNPMPAMYWYVWKTDWTGVFSAEFLQGPEWNIKYGDVENIVVTVTDADGHSARAGTTLVTNLRVLPGEGKTELVPGGPMRILWNNLRSGARADILIDGKQWKRTYLEGRGYGITYGEIEDWLPGDIAPGEHSLSISDVRTKFLVVEPNILPKNESDKKDASVLNKPKTVLAPKVTVSSAVALAGSSVTVQLTGYHPLGTATIILKGQGKIVKLSGFADYTDSNGALTKTARLPDTLTAGVYTLEATDVDGLSAEAAFTIFAPTPPAPKPEPPHPPTSAPTPPPAPTPDPTPLPKPDDAAVHPCPDGSTFSPTFQQCIEDAPQKQSPYDGLPCPDNVDSIPSYATRGCIPQ